MSLEVHWRPFDPDGEAPLLVDFLTSSRWPFHGRPEPSRETAAEWIAEGSFGNSAEARGFWGVAVPGPGTRAAFLAPDTRVAFLAMRELEDPTPVFDLRIAEPWRRAGVGRSALRFLSAWTFGEADKSRVEAHTRADNAAMRGLLRALGWVQEAHHRQAWPSADGTWHDAVTYALLRDDFRRGLRTPRPPLDD